MTETNQTIDFILDINGTHTVLIQRANEPFKDYWALPGGRQRVGEELEDCVVREMYEETGVEIKIADRQLPMRADILGQDVVLQQVRTYSSGKDPRGGNTTVYAAKIKTSPKELEKMLRAGDDTKAVKVFDLDDLEKTTLAFDHGQFLKDYHQRFRRFKNPYPATDIIIEYQDGVVLIERKNKPHGLALPGGFAEYGLSLEENAVKEAKEETGLDVEIINPEHPLCVHSNPKRDPRAHIISMTYIAKGSGKLEAGDDAKNAIVVPDKDLHLFVMREQFAFNSHKRALNDYLTWRRNRYD